MRRLVIAIQVTAGGPGAGGGGHEDTPHCRCILKGRNQTSLLTARSPVSFGRVFTSSNPLKLFNCQEDFCSFLNLGRASVLFLCPFLSSKGQEELP